MGLLNPESRKALRERYSSMEFHTPDMEFICTCAKRRPNYRALFNRGVRLVHGKTIREYNPDIHIYEFGGNGYSYDSKEKSKAYKEFKAHFETLYSDEVLQWLWEFYWIEKLWGIPKGEEAILRIFATLLGERPDIGDYSFLNLLVYVRRRRKEDAPKVAKVVVG